MEKKKKSNGFHRNKTILQKKINSKPSLSLSL